MALRHRGEHARLRRVAHRGLITLSSVERTVLAGAERTVLAGAERTT